MLKNCLVSLHFQLFMWERMVKTDLSKIKSLHRKTIFIRRKKNWSVQFSNSESYFNINAIMQHKAVAVFLGS